MKATDDPDQLAFEDPLDMTAADYSRVAEMTVSRVSASEVRRYAGRWHYSRGAANVMWNYGLWDGAILVGVVGYNVPTMSVCESVFGAEHWASVLHMGRLVCAEDTPRNVESRLIGNSLRMLHEDKPESRAVLSYAAVGRGHMGIVYQATNALYTGTGGDSTYYLNHEGHRRATYQMSASNPGGHLSAAQAVARGWTVHHEPPKHRYLYLLGSKTKRRESLAMLRYPILPYPKRGCEDVGEEL